MYKKAMQWRKAHVPEAMSEVVKPQKAAQLEAAYPSVTIGRDLLGRPTKVFDAGAVEMRDCPVTVDELVRHHIRHMEALSNAVAWRDPSQPAPDAITTTTSPL